MLLRLILVLFLAGSSGVVNVGNASAADRAVALTAPTQPTPVWPEEMPPIEVKVASDSIDAQGKWVQTVRLTIGPGGTLADASRLVYGDVLHVEDIFQAARQKNPGLASPAQVPVGQVIELTIDPSVSFIQQAVAKTDDLLERQFTNGVKETLYLRPTNSVTRVIQFPSHDGIEAFVYPDAAGPVQAIPGGRFVELRYHAPDTYEDLVRIAVGQASFSAAKDFTDQTGWDPTRWPPPEGETKRAVFRPAENYQPRPERSVGPVNDLPEAQPRLKELIAAREQAGIWAIRREDMGIVYRVAIEDPSITAKDVARLLYGVEDGYLRIAQLAGFPSPEGAAQATFNPNLFGRTFEIRVEYPQEQFVLDESTDPTGDYRLVRLLNGTTIERYQDIRRGHAGLQEVVRFPSGFVKVIYRPSEFALTLADAAALIQIGGGDDPEAIERARQAYAAELVWRLAPGVPRELGTTIEQMDLRPAPGGRVMEVTIAPAPANPVQRAISGNPCLNAAAIVVAGSVLVVIVSLFKRRGVGRPSEFA